ncbi:MAG: hypothetical protein KC800_15685 [Candidatus Eremiobacteraeota bacterium]|nr:hypothetical protein [Candidatus Eremiobacteraeota bacterium]
MSDCQSWQQEIDEILAVGGAEDDFSTPLSEHLLECESCREFCQDGLVLNQMMEEPAPLPPADLVSGVMARVASDREPEEVRLPWAERLAWAASGAVAMFFVERLPEFSLSWLSEVEQTMSQLDWAFPVPIATSASTLAVAALVLLAVQGSLVYRTRALI